MPINHRDKKKNKVNGFQDAICATLSISCSHDNNDCMRMSCVYPWNSRLLLRPKIQLMGQVTQEDELCAEVNALAAPNYIHLPPSTIKEPSLDARPSTVTSASVAGNVKSVHIQNIKECFLTHNPLSPRGFCHNLTCHWKSVVLRPRLDGPSQSSPR